MKLKLLLQRQKKLEKEIVKTLKPLILKQLEKEDINVSRIMEKQKISVDYVYLAIDELKKEGKIRETDPMPEKLYSKKTKAKARSSS